MANTVMELEDFNTKTISKTKKLTISAVCIALYCIVMYATASFAFGAYQIRVATSIYALSYIFPFLVVPLGLANFLSNLLGGMGIVDMVGGFTVGIIATGLIVLIRKLKLNICFISLPIIFIPGLIVPIWLTYFTNVPYQVLAVSLCIGQVIPSILGVILIKILLKIWKVGK